MDVLLVPEQQNANFAAMQNIGSNWASTLTNFLNNGGTVIICDGSGYVIYGGREIPRSAFAVMTQVAGKVFEGEVGEHNDLVALSASPCLFWHKIDKI